MPAENQANVKFSHKKYYGFRSLINSGFAEKFYSDMQIDYVSRALCYGDTQPAVVVSLAPLLIAAYSDEMDAVVMLSFPDELAEKYSLSVGARLTTSNVYFYGERCAEDIFPGAAFTRRYADFMPIVQLFVGKNDDKIREKVKLFDEAVWQKAEQCAAEHRRAHPDVSRFGFYYFKK